MCTSCGCNNTETPTTHDAQVDRPATGPVSYSVTGMTCGHCVASVTEEVSAIPGIRDVVVDLATGTLTFDADQPVTRDMVGAAVREAGYALV